MGSQISQLLFTRHIAENAAVDAAEKVVYKIIEGGESGVPGKASDTFVYSQSPASSEWTITHNLDKYPAVAVVDSAGNIVIGDIQYIDRNTVVITFKAAFSGKAYLN